jgi:coenzyme F420-reducing hydrogenase delta subunit
MLADLLHAARMQPAAAWRALPQTCPEEVADAYIKHNIDSLADSRVVLGMHDIGCQIVSEDRHFL